MLDERVRLKEDKELRSAVIKSINSAGDAWLSGECFCSAMFLIGALNHYGYDIVKRSDDNAED